MAFLDKEGRIFAKAYIPLEMGRGLVDAMELRLDLIEAGPRVKPVIVEH